MNTCQKCGKPVYFAERKTSLGKNWHPNCLKCEECGKILSAGLHAEHNGIPYCHKPCYAALFGPRMMGYGYASPANFRKSAELENITGNIYNGHDGGSPVMVYEYGNNNTVKLTPTSKKNSVGTNIYSSQSTSQNESLPKKDPAVKRQEILKKIKYYNEYYHGKGKKRQSVTDISDNSGNVVISGPLRILWGVKKPIRFRHCDEVPPESPTINYRHSCMPGSDIKIPADIRPSVESTTSPLRKVTIDDSMVKSPYEIEGVVMRRRPVKKFNTVAYRGDQRPDKWKRASINGHIYSYETCVFTPSLGSSTSVTVDSTNTTPQVIKALLDKFKVENKPQEYALYIVDEENSERILRDNDIPLLERISLGPEEESGAKLLLRDRMERKQSLLDRPVFEEQHSEEECKEQSDPVKLRDEVETLVALPEPVLRGILLKYKQDEQDDINKLKSRFEITRKRLREQMRLLEKT